LRAPAVCRRGPPLPAVRPTALAAVRGLRDLSTASRLRGGHAVFGGFRARQPSGAHPGAPGPGPL